MTSMHSSANSIRSMDGIRTELSRLEAMITSTSSTHQPETKIASRHPRRGSDCTGRLSSAVDEEEKQGGNLAFSGPLPKTNEESSTARDSQNVAPRQNPHDGAREQLDHSSQSQRISSMAPERGGQPDNSVSSTDYRSCFDESSDVNNQPIGTHAEGKNKSSFLYAEFSKKAESRQYERPWFKLDCGDVHRIMRQSLASIYPPEVVEYVSIRQVMSLCEDHTDLLDKRPSVQRSATGKMRQEGYVEHVTPAYAHQPMVHLRNRLIELRNAIKVSRDQCEQAGYSLSELDKLLLPPGSRSYAPVDRPSLMPEPDGDDSSSVYSEDFHSTTE